MKWWKYMCQRLRCDQQDLEQELDKLGKDGWELCVSATVATSFQINSNVLILIFKREIPEPPTEKENDIYIAPHDGIID